MFKLKNNNNNTINVENLNNLHKIDFIEPSIIKNILFGVHFILFCYLDLTKKVSTIKCMFLSNWSLYFILIAL